MRSLTLLLIPIIFLSSCTIDWSDEKDVKIEKLEKQISIPQDTINTLSGKLSGRVITDINPTTKDF